MALDYLQIEEQAFDILQGDVPETTNWKRYWTNEGRRSIQHSMNFPQMAHFHPDEADIGTTFFLASGTRRIAAPARFKEEADPQKGGLFYLLSGELIPIPRRNYTDIMRSYTLDQESSTPEVYHRIDTDSSISGGATQTAYFEVFPKPSAQVDLFLHAYFYLPEIGDVATPDPADGYTDFLSELSPLLVRDLILKQAYIALEMNDLAKVKDKEIEEQILMLSRDETRRRLSRGMQLRPQLRGKAGKQTRSRIREPWAY